VLPDFWDYSFYFGSRILASPSLTPAPCRMNYVYATAVAYWLPEFVRSFFPKLFIINLRPSPLKPASPHITSPKSVAFVLRSVGRIYPRAPPTITVKVLSSSAVLRQFISISEESCFKRHSPLLAGGVPSVGLRPLTPRHQPGNPRTTTQVAWGITPVANGEL
jgi:hypothetical protein